MADPYKGEDSQLAVEVESSQGTSVTPTRPLGKVAEEAQMPGPEQDWLVTRVIGGNREAFQKHQGQKTYQGGDVPIIIYDGAPLAYLLGSEAFDDTSSPNQHTLTAAEDSKPVSQTIEATYYGRGGGSDMVRTYAGCVPESGEITVNNDDELTVSLSYWAMGVTTSASPTAVSIPDRDPWLFSDADSKLTMFSTDFARVVDFSLTVNNNLSEGRYIAPDADHPSGDARDPYEITYGNAGYELTATIAISDSNIYDELVGPTSGGFTTELAFTRPNGDTLTITADRCNITEAPHPLNAEAERVEVEVSMTPETLTIVVDDSNSTSPGYLP